MIAVFSTEVARMLGPYVVDLGMFTAALCVAVGGLGSIAVFRFARRLDARESTEAQVLLGGTTLVSAGLVSVLATALAGAGAIELIPIAALNVAGSAVAALVIAAVVPARTLRVLVFSAIVLGPFLVLAPELIWLGLLCALVLVVAVEVALHHAREMAHAPESALAACLVASVVALPVLVLYVGVRFILRSARLPLPPSRVP